LEVSDEHLMSKVKEGKLELLNELFNRYSRRIYGYFLKCTFEKADSDDLTQELFIRVLKYRRSYKIGQSVELWLFQIARNMIKDHFKKMKVHNDKFNLVEMFPDRPEEDLELQAEKEKQLYSAMNSLAPEKRELLELSKFQGMKYEQIAILKKTSVGNIKVQVHRTIKELKEIYFSHELNN